jgi:DNA-binding PadR family transcriptional regulator
MKRPKDDGGCGIRAALRVCALKFSRPSLQSVDFFYTYEIMSDTDLTTLEQHLLLAIIGLHPNAYGVSIQDHIKERTGREPSTGSIYAALDRLEEKGFVKTREGEPTKERGGKRKLYFTITGSGQHTLRQSLQAIHSLSHGLRWKGAMV